MINTDIVRTNKVLDVFKQIQTIQYNNIEFNREPLSDFYKPSVEMKEYPDSVCWCNWIWPG